MRFLIKYIQIAYHRKYYIFNTVVDEASESCFYKDYVANGITIKHTHTHTKIISLGKRFKNEVHLLSKKC